MAINWLLDQATTCLCSLHPYDSFRRHDVWAVHGDGMDLVGIQRQQVVVVLEEHDALPCAVEGEALVLGGADVRLVERRVQRDVVVEVADPHERHELVPERVVDVGLACWCNPEADEAGVKLTREAEAGRV